MSADLASIEREISDGLARMRIEVGITDHDETQTLPPFSIFCFAAGFLLVVIALIGGLQ